jgi:hypothetical protein
MNYEEKSIKVSEINLDQENPRIPPVTGQRQAIQSVLTDQGEKIANLASDIYGYGLNPSSRLIVFKEESRYVDGDGNRRLTAIKILETPSLADSFPRIKKRIDAILKKEGKVPTEVHCIIFENREAARHWISINHGGEQEGRGQITWSAEQKDRFEHKHSIGLEALDLLKHKKLITEDDRLNINKTTLDRLLNFKEVKSRLSISYNGKHFSFGDLENLNKTVLELRNKKVDEVYTASKGKIFLDKIFSSQAPNIGKINDCASSKNTGGTDVSSIPRSRRIKQSELLAFGGALPLKLGHVNNLYRDIEYIYNYYLAHKADLSADFIVIFRMSIRFLAETASNDVNLSLKDYLLNNFDLAKSKLNKNIKTLLSNQSVEKNKIVQLFQTGAHNYANSKNEEQAIAMSIILGAILKLTHGI